MTKVVINLREEDQRFIQKAMQAGRYFSESEVVAEGIAELRTRDQIRAAHLSELRAQIAVGLEQLARGEGREWNVGEIAAKGRALLAERAA